MMDLYNTVLNIAVGAIEDPAGRPWDTSDVCPAAAIYSSLSSVHEATIDGISCKIYFFY